MRVKRRVGARDSFGWLLSHSYIEHIDRKTYAWTVVLCQPAYVKLIMLIELDHDVIEDTLLI